MRLVKWPRVRDLRRGQTGGMHGVGRHSRVSADSALGGHDAGRDVAKSRRGRAPRIEP